MSVEWERPSAETLREFVERLAAFRQSLPPEQQRLLDDLLMDALRPEWWEDVEPYWARVHGISVRSRKARRRTAITKRANRSA